MHKGEASRGLGPVPSAPALAEMGDAQALGPGSHSSSWDPQALAAGSQSISLEAQFRSTSLNALAGNWTIPYSELVSSC